MAYTLPASDGILQQFNRFSVGVYKVEPGTGAQPHISPPVHFYRRDSSVENAGSISRRPKIFHRKSRSIRQIVLLVDDVQSAVAGAYPQLPLVVLFKTQHIRIT